MQMNKLLTKAFGKILFRIWLKTVSIQKTKNSSTLKIRNIQQRKITSSMNKHKCLPMLTGSFMVKFCVTTHQVLNLTGGLSSVITKSSFARALSLFNLRGQLVPCLFLISS